MVKDLDLKQLLHNDVVIDQQRLVNLVIIDGKPLGFFDDDKNWRFSIEMWLHSVRKRYAENLDKIPAYIKVLGQDRPKKKNTVSVSNQELRDLLANVPNERKAEFAKILKDGQKANSKNSTISEEELFDFGVKLLRKLDNFVEEQGLANFVDCFSLCDISYYSLFRNRNNQEKFIHAQILKCKGNFYNVIASSFNIHENMIDLHLRRMEIDIVKVPKIINIDMFKKSEIKPIKEELSYDEPLGDGFVYSDG